MTKNASDILESDEEETVIPAGRTPLAKVRTYLADRRSDLAGQRTAMSRGRTGLAFFRTGIALVTIAVTLIRLSGSRLLLPFDIILIAAGIAAVIDGLIWYLPVRRSASRIIEYEAPARPTGEITVLEVEDEEHNPRFRRGAPVAGAGELRERWGGLSPVRRRRFLADDRTDLAEERTVYSSLRTTMARARMGLAFARSGVAFAALGVALLRKVPGGGWEYFDVLLISTGALMTLEGFLWYLPGYRAGRTGLASFRSSLSQKNIWDAAFPRLSLSRGDYPPVRASHAPGIWGTTGLALERTVLAERRNVMSRLRTVMAYSRTGLAYIRTGMSIAAIGAGLIVFLAGSPWWTSFEALLTISGLLLVADGLRWYRGSERIRKQFPYCYGDMEISLPDYGIPKARWSRVVFSHDDH